MAPEYQDQDLQKRQNMEAQIHKAVHTNTGFTNMIHHLEIQIAGFTITTNRNLQVRKSKESNGKRRHSLSAKLSFLHL